VDPVLLTLDPVHYIVDPLLRLDAGWVYLIVGALVFAEAAIFVGFVFPGETAVILGGVVASQGHAQLWVVIVVVVFSAILGDTVGYAVGRRYGPRLLRLRLIQRRHRGVDAAVIFIQRRGAFAVFLGRFTAFLRAVVPGLAGLSGMAYPRFVSANAAGGVAWGVGYVLLGYAFGNAYRRVEQYSAWASWGFLALAVAVVVVLILRGRRRERALVDELTIKSDAQPESTGP
jgi:membrane-associated protein